VLICLSFRKPEGFEKSFSENSKIPRFARNDNFLSLFFGYLILVAIITALSISIPEKIRTETMPYLVAKKFLIERSKTFFN